MRISTTIFGLQVNEISLLPLSHFSNCKSSIFRLVWLNQMVENVTPVFRLPRQIIGFIIPPSQAG